MGIPILTSSFDYKIFYPYAVDPFVKYFSRVHPNWITSFNCIIKIFAYQAAITWNWQQLLWLGSFERWLDCLDGQVARRYNKCSEFGHQFDKLSDLVFRFGTAIHLIGLSFPLFAEDFLGPLLLLAVCFACPAVFIYDAARGHIVNMNTQADSLCIYVEDNATLLCLILPLLQWLCVSRCQSLHGTIY